jgi:hypothetical protein
MEPEQTLINHSTFEGDYFHDDLDLQIVRISKLIHSSSLDIDDLYIN